MTINVSEALCPDLALVLEVLRPSSSQEIVDGLLVKPEYTKFTAMISPQQPQYKELQVLPEGERQKDIYKFVSNKELRTASDHDGTLADYVLFKGNQYKIIFAGDWQTFGHTVAFGVRERYNQNTSGSDSPELVT